jgi:hypothetical protein
MGLVIVELGRDTEDGERAVAFELVDPSALGLDHAHDLAEEPVQQLHHVCW